MVLAYSSPLYLVKVCPLFIVSDCFSIPRKGNRDKTRTHWAFGSQMSMSGGNEQIQVISIK